MCPLPARSGRIRKPRLPGLTALRRREIVAAAVKVFSRRGFEAARAEDIAHAARIAKGTLYLYFRTKEALYAAAITHAVRELQELSAERVGAEDSFRDRLAAAISVRLHFWTEHQMLYRLLLTLGRETRHRRQTNQLLRSGQQHLLKVFEAGVGSGELRKANYGPIAWAVLDMIRGATERRMDHISDTQPEQDAAAITAFALQSVDATRGGQAHSAAASTETIRIGRSRMRTPLA